MIDDSGKNVVAFAGLAQADLKNYYLVGSVSRQAGGAMVLYHNRQVAFDRQGMVLWVGMRISDLLADAGINRQPAGH